MLINEYILASKIYSSKSWFTPLNENKFCLIMLEIKDLAKS